MSAALDALLAWIEATASEEERQKLARYGIPDDRAYGLPMRAMKAKGKAIGQDHNLAEAAWATGVYEAQTIAVFIADPARMTEDRLDAWCRGFDNWAICDTACFHLFDRTASAWEMVDAWALDPAEYVRRAAFALIWALSVHDKSASDDRFRHVLSLIAETPEDPRPHVKKAVDMALRAVGKRNRALNAAASETAATLAAAPTPTRAWIGRHARRELESEKVLKRQQG